MGYAGYLQNGVNSIGMFNLSNPNVSLIATFNNSGRTISVDKLCLTDQHLLAYTSGSQTIYYFSLSNRTCLGSFNLNDYPNTMIFLPIRNWVVYTTTNGAIKYFNSSLNSMEISIMMTSDIASNLLAPL